MRAIAAVLLIAAAACRTSPLDRERALRSRFQRITGRIVLPAGITELHAPLEFPNGAHDISVQGDTAGSTLRLAADFHGKAAIVGAHLANIEFAAFQVTGQRSTLTTNSYLPKSDQTFFDYYDSNGIALTDSRAISIHHLGFRNVVAFPILISQCAKVTIDSVTIDDSGSLNSLGHSNTSGGILLEQGTNDFSVKLCHIRNICGNGIWTHANYRTPRNEQGVIEGNEIDGTPRDAIQVGHADHIQVLNNKGSRIGYPPEQADLPSGATPVALDSAGDVSDSTYSGNHFEDVDGQCIDLDGFHDGRIGNNSCVNRQPLAAYPLSHEGIVFGNSNPDMISRNVLVTGNLIQGFGYGGVYLIGENHRIVDNRFIDINRNHCTGDMSIARCNYAPDEPGMLRSGVYLAGRSQRPADTRDNLIERNTISGFGMDKWCVAAGPGVALARNTVAANTCVTAEK